MRSFVARSISAIGACVLLVVSTQCSVSVSNPGKTGSTTPSSASIGAAGGSVTSTDGHLQMSVPANALAGNVTITVNTITQAGAVGTAYDIEPTGTQFAVPVTMMINYAGEDLGTTSPADLQIAVYATSGWQALAGQSLDTANETVSGTTMHLSTYGLTAQGQTQLCVDTSGGWGCAGGGAPIDAGVGGGSSGGSSSSSGGSGGCTAPTCSSLDPCSGYVGATVGSCNVGTSSWQATCCFAAGAPVCVNVSSGSGCASADAGVTLDSGAGGSSSGGSGGSSGSGGGCATPTCADAVCPDGTTLQSCTNMSDGYTASCCYAAGVVPTGGSSSGGSADSGVGSSGGGIDAGSGSSSGGGTEDSGPEDSGASGTIDAGSGAPDAGGLACGTCDTDAECETTCPPVKGGANCCDTGSHTCFASVEPTCPADAGSE